MKKIFGFVLGAFLGGAIGAGVALLFAPESGQDMRQHLRERGEQFTGELKEAASTRRAQLEDRLAMLRKPAAPAAAD